MSRYLNVRQITLKGIAVFICDSCNTQAFGDTVTQTFDHWSDVANYRPGPHAMPIGWRSDHSLNKSDHLRFTCPRCHSTAPLS